MRNNGNVAYFDLSREHTISMRRFREFEGLSINSSMKSMNWLRSLSASILSNELTKNSSLYQACSRVSSGLAKILVRYTWLRLYESYFATQQQSPPKEHTQQQRNTSHGLYLHAKISPQFITSRTSSPSTVWYYVFMLPTYSASPQSSRRKPLAITMGVLDQLRKKSASHSQTLTSRSWQTYRKELKGCSHIHPTLDQPSFYPTTHCPRFLDVHSRHLIF